jgi:hypothetical protein
MRKIYCLIFLLSVIFSKAFAQFSFPSTNATWIYQYYNEFHQPGPFSNYQISGDTVIGNRNYKRISGCATWLQICNSGSIRDSNNVVYFIPDTCSTEYVLYDFNLNIGDTLFHPYDESFTGNSFVVVMNISWVGASDGAHRRLGMNTMDGWIEGIGSDGYLFMPTTFGNFALSGEDFLQCMSTDSGDWYGYPCIVPIDNYFEIADNIVVYPNPIGTSARVQFNRVIKNGELRIFNSMGELVLEEKILSKAYYILDRKSLPNGIYFLQLKTETGIVQKKIIVG